MKRILKYKKSILILLIIFVVSIFGYVFYKEISHIILEKKLADLDWLKKNINLVLDDDLGCNIYNVSKNKNISIFNLNYQNIIEEKIKDLKSEKYTFEDPLLILNPYGTNNLGLNIYFKTEEEIKISYTISVDNDKIVDFSRTLNNGGEDNYATNHEYQIIGMVQGEVNNIELVAIDRNDNKSTYSFTIDMSNFKSQADTILETVDGNSEEDLEDGLFVLFGLDKAFNANNYIYDNNGILRADLVLHEYRSDRIIFLNDNLYYSYDTDKIAVVNRLGKIEKEYNLKNYEMHHDYVFDESNNKLLILVNDITKEDVTIEDLVISLDLDTGDVEEVIDMKTLMPDIYESGIMPESGKNTYGGNGLDWIHLNSLSVIEGKNDIILSSRELSTLIYVENIYDNPNIKYLITDKEVYMGTNYENLVLEKQGDFVNQAGQHTITYVSDDKLDEGQYYLIMYNNNYGASNTRKNFPWNNYPGVGTFNDGDKSMYYKYLVDENEGTYELVEEFDVAYSSIVSSVQDLEKNHVTSSGKSNCYGEYDEDGKMIKQFNYTAKKYAYRVFKYNFENVWFN